VPGARWTLFELGGIQIVADTCPLIDAAAPVLDVTRPARLTGALLAGHVPVAGPPINLKVVVPPFFHWTISVVLLPREESNLSVPRPPVVEGVHPDSRLVGECKPPATTEHVVAGVAAPAGCPIGRAIAPAGDASSATVSIRMDRFRIGCVLSVHHARFAPATGKSTTAGNLEDDSGIPPD
jgi:hypothetical protein